MCTHACLGPICHLQLLEPITLALGYFGNLSERTSVLAGFALLSITLKFLSVLYLMLTTKVVMLIVIHGTLGAFHIVEAVRPLSLPPAYHQYQQQQNSSHVYSL